MSAGKQAHPARAVLTRAIENKVERMDMGGLIELATALRVPVPAAAKAMRGRERKSVARPSARKSKVLQGTGSAIWSMSSLGLLTAIQRTSPFSSVSAT
jgi:hypothetical protein